MEARKDQISKSLTKLARLLPHAPNFADREMLIEWTEALEGITVEQITEIFGRFKREAKAWPPLSAFLEAMEGGGQDLTSLADLLVSQIAAYCARRAPMSLAAAEAFEALGGFRGLEWFDTKNGYDRERLRSEIRAHLDANPPWRCLPALQAPQPQLALPESAPIDSEREIGSVTFFRESEDERSIPQDEARIALARLMGECAHAPLRVADSITDAAVARAKEIESSPHNRQLNRTERAAAIRLITGSITG